MAVPKSKVSKQRTNKRFANFKAQAPALVECPHCHELKKPHKVCASCGYYDDTQVVEKKEMKAE